MKGAIFFEGKDRATRQYAEWLSGELHLPSIEVGRNAAENPGHYDFLLIGSPISSGRLKIEKWLWRNLRYICSARSFLFMVTTAPAKEPGERLEIIKASVPGVMRNHCETYFLPGRLTQDTLSWTHRMISNLVGHFRKYPDKKAGLEDDGNVVKRENLVRMINAVKSYYLRGAVPGNTPQPGQGQLAGPRSQRKGARLP